MQFVLKILSSRFTVVRLDASAALPPWALAGEFCSITRTANELSIVCESVQVPDGLCSETDWRALEVQGPLQFDQVGIMAALTAPSPRMRRWILGMRNATKKASAEAEAPKVMASTRSRMKPNSREIRVIEPTAPAALLTFLLFSMH